MTALWVLLALAAVNVIWIGWARSRPITDLDRRLTAIDEVAAPTPAQHARHPRRAA